MATHNNSDENEICEDEGAPLRQPNESAEQVNFEETEVPQGCSQKCIYIFRNITVEPCLFLFLVAIMLVSTASSNLGLEKACRVNLGYPANICDTLLTRSGENQSQYERESQQLVTAAISWQTYITATIPSVLVLFAGSFSDKTGYKKCFITLAVIGQVIGGVNNLINIYFFTELNLQVLVLSDALISGLTGGGTLISLSAFAYISSVSTEKDRTFRLGLLNFNVAIAFPIGIGIGAPLLKIIGFYGVFGISTGLHFLNMLYIIFVVKDPPRSKEQKEHDGRGCVHLFRTFFDVSNVRDTLKVVYKKAPNSRRTRMCIYLLVICVLFGPVYGEAAVLYLSTRYRFNWDEVDFSIFQIFNFVIGLSGTIFSVVVFSKYLQWHDSVLGITSSISKICGAFVFAFAPNEKIFYIGPLVTILSGTAMLAMRSIFTKLVEPNELGSINSVIGLTENLMPLLYVPMYTQLYTATMETLPGAVFLIGGAMSVPAAVVMTWLLYEHLRNKRNSNTVMQQNLN